MTAVPTSSVAVLLIDMQNAFCHPEGSFGKVGADVSGTNAAIGGCVKLVDTARAAGVPIIFTRAIHTEGFTDWKILSELPMFDALKQLGSCQEGTWDAELVDELKPSPDDLVITKSRFSPFVDTDIESRLHAMGIENLVVGGVGTSACVESSVRDAGQREFRVYVAEEACGDLSEGAHTTSLAIMTHMFGWGTTVDEVAASWA
jgi:ureidoacrylate peracid hydrolase